MPKTWEEYKKYANAVNNNTQKSAQALYNSSKRLAEKKLSDTYEQLDVQDSRVVAKQAIANAEQEQFARLRTTQITNDIAKDQLITPDTSSQETSIGSVLGSGAIGLVKGAISLPDMAVTLADMAISAPENIYDYYSNGNKFDGEVNYNHNRLRKGLASVGFRPDEAKSILDSVAPTAQKVQEAELEAINDRQDLTTVGKYFEAAKHVLTSPNLIANMGTNSLVQMGAGGVIGRGVSAATGLGAVTSVAIGEGTMAATNNINEQNAQNGGITRQDILAAGAVGATTAGFGRVLNSGKYDIDNILAGMRQVSQGTTRKDLINMVATPFREALEETAQEGSEQAINNMRDDKPIDDHLGTSAGAGAALGGILGSVGSVSPAVRTVGKATNKVNAALSKVLATDNTDKMLNPEDKRYNPAGVYRKSINDLSKVTDENSEEGKAVAAKATKNMQLAFESVQNKVKDMVTQYNAESDPVVKAQIKKEITEFRKNHFEPLTTAYTNFQEFKTQKADEGLTQLIAQSQQIRQRRAANPVTAPQINNNFKVERTVKNRDGVDVPLSTIKTLKGKTVEVATEYAHQFQGFINDLENLGYTINTIGGFSDRANVNSKGNTSKHGYGYSIDINPSNNPNRSTKTDMPVNEVRKLVNKWGLGWGMDWKSVKDPMHFSVAPNEGGRKINLPNGQVNSQANSSVRVNDFSGAVGISNNQKRNMGMVANALDKYNVSPEFKKVMLGQIGREGSFDFSNLRSSHGDAANGKSNIGIISFQGSRHTNLKNYLASKGLYKNGQVVGTDEQLVQANVDFMMNEINSNPKYAKTKSVLTSNNKDEIWLTTSDNYIAWARKNPKFAADGTRNFNTFYGAASNGVSTDVPNTMGTQSDSSESNLIGNSNKTANLDAAIAEDQEIMAANDEQQAGTEANATESTDPEEDAVNEQIGEHIAKNAESYSASMLEQVINSSLLSEDQKNQLKKLHDIKQAETQGTDKVIPSNTVAKTPEETSNHAEAQNLYKRYATLSLDDVNNNTAISDKQKEVLRSLLSIKQAIKGESIDDTNDQINFGKVTNIKDPTANNLGIVNYNEKLSQTLSEGNATKAQRTMSWVNRFANNHISKLEAATTAYKQSAETGEAIRIAANEDNVWSIVDDSVSDEEFRKAGGLTIVAGTSDNLISKISEEANSLSTFRDTWANVFNDFFQTEGYETILPSDNKGNSIASRLASQLASIETPAKPSTSTTPTSQTPTTVAPTAPVATPINNNPSNKPVHEKQVSIVQSSTGNKLSMSQVETDPDNVKYDNHLGWLANPFTVFKGSKTKNQMMEDGTTKQVEAKRSSFQLDTAQERTPKYIEMFNKLFNENDTFASKVIGLKDQHITGDKFNQESTAYVNAVLSKMPTDLAKAREYLNTLEYDQQTGAIKVPAQLGTLDNQDENNVFVGEGGINLDTSKINDAKGSSKKVIDDFISTLENSDKELIFNESGIANELETTAPKGYAYLNKQLNEKFNFNNDKVTKQARTPVTSYEFDGLTDEDGNTLSKERSTVVKNKGSKSTNGVAREPIKEMNPKTMEQREAEKEAKDAVVSKQKVNKDTVPEKLLSTKQDTPDTVIDSGKVNKLSDVIKEVRLIESDKISNQEQQYYAELIDSLLGYSPNIEIQFNPSVASSVKDNTIIVGNTSTALEHIARVLLTKATDELASTITDVVYDENDGLSKLGVQLDSIRRDLKYAINDRRNGEYKLDIMMLLNEMTKDNGKLISIGLSNQRVMEFLKTIKTDRSKKEAKTNLFKRIVLAIGSYFNMNSNKSQNLFERLLEVGAKTAVTQNAVDSEYDYSKSGDALLPQLRGVTPEQAENERSKPFNERNLMVASFTQDQSKPLAKTSLLASKLRDNMMRGITELSNIMPSTEQRNQLTDFLGFRDEFVGHLLDTFKAKESGYEWQDMKSYLVDDTGSLDENTLTAVALTVYSWAIENGNKSLNTYEDVMKLLNLDPEDNTAHLPRRIYNQYAYAGTVNTFVTDALGTKVIKALGIKISDDANPELRSRLEQSIGQWAVNAMQSADLVHIQTKPSATHLENIKEVGGEIPATLNAEGVVTFVSISDSDGNNINDRLLEIIEASKGTKGFLSQLFGVEVGLRSPTLEPTKEVNTHIKGTKSIMPKSQADKLKRIQDEPFKVNTAMYGVMDTLYKKNADALLLMLGAKVTDEVLDYETHEDDVLSVLSAAEGKERELLNMFDFVSGLAKTVGGEFQQFYDSIYSAKNTRMHYNSNMVNIQTSKIQRAAVEYANFKVKHDIKDFSNSFGDYINDEGYPTPLGKLIQAIAENAEGTEKVIETMFKTDPMLKDKYTRGFTVDKIEASDYIPAFMQYLKTDKKVAAAVSAMETLLTDADSITEAQIDDISELVSTWEMEGLSLRALMEYTQFNMAVESGADSYTSSFGLGSDGVNNGAAIGTIQTGSANEDFMKMVGLFDEESGITSYQQTRSNADISDYYEGLGKILEPMFNSAIASDKKFAAIVELSPSIVKNGKIGRKILKDLLIPFNYSATIKRITQVAFGRVLSDTKKEMMAIFKDAMLNGETDILVNRYLNFQSNLQTILGADFKLPPMEELKTFWFDGKQLSALNEAFIESIGESIKEGVSEYAKDFIPVRDQNIAYHRATYDFYSEVRNQIIDAATIKRKAEIKTRLENDGTVKAIREKAKDKSADAINAAIDKRVDDQFAREGFTKNEWNKLVEEPLALINPTLSTPMDMANLVNNEMTGFQLAKQTYELASDPVTQTTGYRVDTEGNLVSSSNKLPVRKTTVESNGLVPNASQTQSVDATVTLGATADTDKVNVNVHDNNIGAIDSHNNMVFMQNKTFYQTLVKYHPQLASVMGLLTTLDSYTHLKETNKVTTDIEFETQLVDSLLTTLLKNQEQIDMFTDLKLQTEATGGEYIGDVVIPTLNELIKVGIQADINKLNSLSKIKIVHQYAGEGGHYTVTEDDASQIQEQIKALENIQDDLIKHTKDMMAKFDKREVGQSTGTKSIVSSQAKDIYQKLLDKSPNKTEVGHVTLKRGNGAIWSLRNKTTNPDNNFGNPFSSVERLLNSDRGLIRTSSTRESVERYIDWVLSDTTTIEPVRHAWIREKLQSGNLKGRMIAYYAELNEPSHANALDYLINEHEWNTEGKVVLTGSSQYLAKDQAKSDQANKFIGYGVEGSSTNTYRLDWGKKANTGKYSSDDKVFVSINGDRKGRIHLNGGYKTQLNAAMKAGATIITDNASDRKRDFNIGEREVAQYLHENGYVEVGNGIWVPSKQDEVIETKQYTVFDLQKSVNKMNVSHDGKVMFVHVGNKVLANNRDLRFVMDNIEDSADGKLRPGVYSIETNTITLNNRLYKSENAITDEVKLRVIMHEMYHALTETGMSKDTQATQDLQAMYEYLKPLYKGNHSEAFSNINEFVAYGMTEPEVAKFISDTLDSKALKTVGVKAKRTLTDKFKEFLDLVYKVLGLEKSIGFKNFADRVEATIEKYNKDGISVSVSSTKQATDSRFATIGQQLVNNMTTSEVIKGLSATNVSTDFNTHLDEFIDKILATYETSNPIRTRFLGVSKANPVRGTKAISAGYRLSDKEMHVIDAVQLMTEEYLKRHAGSASVTELYKIYDELLETLPVSSFIPNYATASKQDKQYAKNLRDYVFSAKAKNDKAFMARFVSLAVGSEQFKDIISKPRTRVKRDINKPIFDRIMNVVESVVDWLKGVVLHTRNGNYDSQVVKLLNNLNNIDARARENKANLLDKAWAKTAVPFSYLNNKTNAVINKLVANSSMGNSRFKFINQSVAMAKTLQELPSLAGGVVNAVTASNKNKLLSEGLEIANEIAQGSQLHKWADTILRKVKFTEGIRKGTDQAMQRVLASHFTDELTKEDKVAMTKVVLRTDLGSILDLGMNKIQALVSNKDKRSKMIKQLEANVKQHKNFNDLLIQTKALAAYMALEITPSGLSKNAESIAAGVGTEYEVGFNLMDTDLAKDINTLATLYALDYTSQEHIDKVVKLFNEQPKGIKELIRNHADLVSKSKEDFAFNPYNYIKGYTPQITNPNRDMVFAFDEAEAKMYEAQGYERLTNDELARDPHDKTDPRIGLVHRSFKKPEYVSGIMDMYDTHAKGSVVYNEENPLDLNRVTKAKLAERKLRNAKGYEKYNPLEEENSLVINYGADGHIIDYHYEMNGYARDGLLERNNDAFVLMGAWAGDIAFKPEVKKMQRTVIESLYIDYKKNYHKTPAKFVFLDPNSTDERVLQQWRMLPFEARERAKDLFGAGKPIAVRSDVFNTVFGFRSYTIRDMFDKLTSERNGFEKFTIGILNFIFGENAKNKAFKAEQTIIEIEKYIKNSIVVRNVGVLMGNIFSNSLMLMLHGISPTQMLTGYVTAWRNGRRYTDRASELKEIDIRIANGEKGLLQKRNVILKELAASPVHKYIMAGVKSTIVDDVSLEKSNDKYLTRIETEIDKVRNKLPTSVQTGLDWLLMSQDTPIYQLMVDATQFSDFAAKYALAEHYQKQGMAFNDAVYEAQEMFINFDTPTTRSLDYANRLGLIRFTKFLLRFQKILVKTIRDKPASVILQSMATEHFLGAGSVTDSLLMTRLGVPLDGSVLSLADAIGGITTVDMLTNMI